MSSDHHDGAGPARIAVENGIARDEGRLKPPGDVTAMSGTGYRANGRGRQADYPVLRVDPDVHP